MSKPKSDLEKQTNVLARLHKDVLYYRRELHTGATDIEAQRVEAKREPDGNAPFMLKQHISARKETKTALEDVMKKRKQQFELLETIVSEFKDETELSDEQKKDLAAAGEIIEKVKADVEEFPNGYEDDNGAYDQ